MCDCDQKYWYAHSNLMFTENDIVTITATITATTIAAIIIVCAPGLEW